ncbi:MAG: PAS domain S-box protein [Leptolyngbya sp. BL-A-14]
MERPSLENLFAGDSEIAASLRSLFADADKPVDGVHNGSQRLLGAIEIVSPSLKNALSILLNAYCPMFLVWDFDPIQEDSSKHILFYNDAYLTLLKETQQFIPCGRSINESWSEAWSSVQSAIEHVFETGQPLRREEPFPINPTSPLTATTNAQTAAYTWSYSAIWNEMDRVNGVFATGYPINVEGIQAHPSDFSQNDQKISGTPRGQQTCPDDGSLQKAEVALRESEARFQAFMSHSPTAAWIADREGRLLYLSPTYAQMFQSSEQNVVGKQIRYIYSEEFTQQFLENNRRVFETGQVIETIETAPRLDGSIGSFLVYKFPILQASGEMLLGGVAVDITERKQTEEVLRRREEELRLITNALPVLIAYVDKDHYYRFNNQLYETWLEQPLTNLVNKHVREALGETAYAAVRPYMEQALAGNRICFESQLAYGGGKIRYVSAEYLSHMNSEGDVEGFFSLVSDITDRKQAETEREQLLQALTAERARFEAVLRQMPEGVIIADAASGTMILANERTNQILRHEFELNRELEAYDQKVPFHAYHPDGQEYAPDDYPLARSLRTGEVITHEEMEIRFGDGIHIVIDASASPIFNSQGQIASAVVVIQDITDRKQAEIALRQSEEQLRLAQRAAGAGLWDWDIVANRVTWSEEYYRLYGLDATIKPSYDNWLASILECDRDRTDQASREALEHKSDLNVEFRIFHPTQGERWLNAIGQTFCDHNGHPTRMTGIALDITKRKQAEKALERYQLLSEHSRDIVLYFRSDGQILEANQAAVQAYGYDRAELLTLKVADLRAPETLSAMPEQFEQAIQRGILFETVHRHKNGTEFPVEVSSQSAVIENETVLLSVIRNITERKRAELEREELLVREQVAREAAEAAEQRSSFLAETSTTLTSSLDYEYTLSSVAQAVVPTLADWCAIDILNDDGTLSRLATAHIDPAKVQWGKELHRRYPPDLNAPHGLAQVIRTGQAEYHPTISDDQIVAAARDAEHLNILREVGMSSVMLVPLNARGKTLGAISFVAAESGHSYSAEDLSLAEELARRAAIALDNARLYKEAQQARQAAERAADRISRLQTVTAALSESLTPEQVAEVIVTQSMATLKAAAALVVLVSSDRTELEIVKAVGYETDLVNAWQRFSIDSDVPLAQAIRTGEPIWVETLLERIARYPHLAEIYRRYDFNAWIAIPLMAEGNSVGGMLLSFKEFTALDQDDREFILALSRQCAQAIVRAQLYKAEQEARAGAEQANRIKDEFLAVLSHELRSPLNPILGWSKLLRSGRLDAARTDHALETIERNAQLQVQLIDDLLDISRILRGKLSLNAAPVDLSFIITAALETVRLAADAKALQVQTFISPTIGMVNGDAGRLQQVVWNLLSNAVKFTPANGSIIIELTAVGTQAQIQIKDTGKGISPDFLPYVFEHFRQEDGATTRKFGGLGLGLAIVRQLVELHGGTVAVESPGEGQGSTFTVRLPLAVQSKALSASQEPSETLLDLSGIHILIVDDDADSRDFIAFVLEQANAIVRCATSGSEALQSITESTPDLVVSDIGMPTMDGYMLLQRIRALDQGQSIPAIALTAYASEINQKQALAAGFQKHLTKPVEPDKLIEAVANLVVGNA